MSWQEDRKAVFALAKEAEMVDDLAEFARVFGRLQAVCIQMNDGRHAEYRLPSGVSMKPVENQKSFSTKSSSNSISSPRTSRNSSYARARSK